MANLPRGGEGIDPGGSLREAKRAVPSAAGVVRLHWLFLSLPLVAPPTSRLETTSRPKPQVGAGALRTEGLAVLGVVAQPLLVERKGADRGGASRLRMIRMMSFPLVSTFGHFHLSDLCRHSLALPVPP